MSERILPVVDDLNRPFWDGCRNGVLTLQRCDRCGRLRYPIAPVCPQCLGCEWSWEPVSGRGSVYSFAVFRHAYNDAWRDRLPYTVALVELEEGVTMIANLVGVEPERVRVGLSVAVGFEAVTPDVSIPHFVPADS